MKNFYLVYNVETNRVFGLYDTTEEAIEKAKKQAESDCGNKYYVCSGLYGYAAKMIITEPEFFALENSRPKDEN
jgi:hypothetical protein